ncbi:MAG: HAMP domain-containing histidine kinase [Bdellovibrionaceae bacterium]|nr:HAMP domain-containing histidine kinase [Pseudobdellovibrionaceae bacterium]
MLFFVFLISFLFVSTILFYTRESQLNFKEQESTISDLFVSTVKNDILSGDYDRVYKHCKALMKYPNISHILIATLDNYEICNISNTDKLPFLRHQIVKNIHFDESNMNLAATSSIVFSRISLIQQVMLWSLLIFSICTVFFLISMYLANKVSIFIGKPMEIITEVVKSNNLEQIRNITKLELNHSRETKKLSEEIKNMAVNIIDYQRIQVENEKKLMIAEVAKQVAHDIRSPLSALKMVAKKSDQLNDQESKLLNGAIDRINEVAEDLLLKERQSKNSEGESITVTSKQNVIASKSELMVVNLSQLVQETIEFKSIECFNNTNIKIKSIIDNDSLEKNVEVDPKIFKRVLSNLINNSVEAINPDRPGLVTLNLSKENSDLILELRDNGCGLTSDQLNNILENGISLNKSKGNGLGLKYAKEIIEGINGRFKIYSKLGTGTTVHISLPIAYDFTLLKI